MEGPCNTLSNFLDPAQCISQGFLQHGASYGRVCVFVVLSLCQVIALDPQGRFEHSPGLNLELPNSVAFWWCFLQGISSEPWLSQCQLGNKEIQSPFWLVEGNDRNRLYRYTATIRMKITNPTAVETSLSPTITMVSLAPNRL